MKELWNERFPNCPPLSYMFKHCLPDRWLRIHSLPESKRYPDNLQEQREVLRRFNSMLFSLIGKASTVTICHAVFDGDNSSNSFSLKDLDLKLFDRIPKDSYDPEENEEPIFVNCYFAEVQIEHGDLDDIFLSVALDEIENLFVFHAESNRIFAPYDGGADIILESSETRYVYSRTFADWLSPREDGL